MKIRFAGWIKGMNKIEFIQVLYGSGIPLMQAKKIKDKIVDGEIIEIIVDEKYANEIASKSLEW